MCHVFISFQKKLCSIYVTYLCGTGTFLAAVVDWQLKAKSNKAFCHQLSTETQQSTDIHEDSDIEAMFPAPDEGVYLCHCLFTACPLCRPTWSVG